MLPHLANGDPILIHTTPTEHLPPPTHLQWDVHTSADISRTWALMSDTDRFNRVAGLGMRFDIAQDANGKIARTGKLRRFGLTIHWEEIPVQYEADRGFLIERLYDRGPAQRSITQLQLRADGSGTQIKFEVDVYPRTRLLGAVVAFEMQGIRRKMANAFKIFLDALDGNRDVPDLSPPPLSASARQRLELGLRQVEPPRFADELHTFLLDAPLSRQNRIRPLQLAKQWQMADDDVLRGCLSAVRAGVLLLKWDLICPSCRMPSASVDQLGSNTQEIHCMACDVRYDASLADSVEVVMRPNPAIRDVELAIECLSSPARAPHLLAQMTLQAGAYQAWNLNLLPGAYRVRSMPPIDTASLVVRADLPAAQVPIIATEQGFQPALLRAPPGAVTLQIHNKLAHSLTLIIERRWQEPYTLTAGRLLEMPGALELLPPDALAAGVHVEILRGAVLAVQIQRGGDESVGVVVQWLQELHPSALQAGNALVVAMWPTLDQALVAASRLQGALFLSSVIALGPVLVLHRGAERFASGQVARRAVALSLLIEAGETLVDEATDFTTEWLSTEKLWAKKLVLHPRPKTAATSGQILEFTKRSGPVLQLPTRNPRPPAPGDTIAGQFVLDQPLGEGGFGAVYAARDLQSAREVVVKILHNQLSDDPAQVQRFYNEGRLASRLQGRNVVSTYDFGHTEDGRLYIVMEKLNGRELADILSESGTIDPWRALNVGIGALLGLAEAHKNGLVHRDIKPSNLLLCQEENGDERTVVIDFGIAVDTTGQVVSPSEFGISVGTPRYMSPEQLRGNAVDGRADLYAVGIVLYQVCTGQLPFVGDTAIAELMARITDEPLTLGADGDQPLPEGLAQTVTTALQREAKARFADADAMRQSLQEVLKLAGDHEQWQRRWSKFRLGRTLRIDPRISGLVSETQVTAPMPISVGQDEP